MITDPKMTSDKFSENIFGISSTQCIYAWRMRIFIIIIVFILIINT